MTSGYWIVSRRAESLFRAEKPLLTPGDNGLEAS